MLVAPGFQPIEALAVLPAGNAVTGGEAVVIWQLPFRRVLDARGEPGVQMRAGICDGEQWHVHVLHHPGRHVVQALAALPENRLASGDAGGAVLIWDTDNGELLRTLSEPEPVQRGVGITTLVVVGAGTELASATDSDEGCVTLYAINCYL